MILEMAETTRTPSNRTRSTGSSGQKKSTSARRSTGAARSTSAGRSTSRTRSAASKPAATKPTGTARRQSAATKRSTSAKRATATRANNETRRQAARAAEGPKNRAETVQAYAERAVLVQVGAALEARDRVVSTVNEVVDFTTSRAEAERQLKKFERRGSLVRTQVEREVRKTRTRVERDLRERRARLERTVRENRTRVERDLRGAERDGRGLRDNVAANVDLVTSQVENAVQSGITAGARIVATATERVTA
jgi:hypothetical protein